jgi:hypothetical protein
MKSRQQKEIGQHQNLLWMENDFKDAAFRFSDDKRTKFNGGLFLEQTVLIKLKEKVSREPSATNWQV